MNATQRDVCCPKCHESWMHGWESRNDLLEFLFRGVSTGYTLLRKRFSVITCNYCGFKLAHKDVSVLE